jgi:O-antigen ligase/tetratricopeptide (TPR) repeat protein
MRWPQRLCEGFVIAGVVVLPLCLGGAPWWSLWVLVCWSCLLTLAWGLGYRNHRRRRTSWPAHVSGETDAAALRGPGALSMLLVAGGLCAVVALVQLVPLPDSVLAQVSPRAFELKSFALLPLGITDAQPISLDAPSTWRALARSLALTAALVVVSLVSSESKVRRRLLASVAVMATGVAVLGLGHLVAQAETLFGVYRFFATLNVVTPFGNVNHLAAFLAFGSTIGLGLAASASSRDRALGWGVVAVLPALVTVLTLSRSGIGGLVLGWAGVAAVAFVDRSQSVRRALPILAIGGVALLALALAAEPVLARLDTISTVERLKASKIELWPSFFSSAWAHKAVGMGLGAFELGYTRDQTSQFDVTFTHPENIVLQWLSEAGFVVAVALLVVVAWAWARAWRRWRGRWLERVVLVALLALVAHDLFDFALEFNAVALAAVVAAGVLSHRRVEGPKRGVFGALVAACALAAIATFKGLPTHLAAEARLASSASTQWREVLMQSIARHPADWVLSAQAAKQALPQNPSESLAWVNRTLFLRPSDGPSHASAAWALASLKQPGQARLEARLAWERSDSSALPLAVKLAVASNQWDGLFSEYPGIVTAVCRQAIQEGGVAAGQACVAAAVAWADGATVVPDEAHLLGLEFSLGERRTEDALAHLTALSDSARGTASAKRMAAKAKALAGDVSGARAELRALLMASPSDVAAVQALAALEVQAGRVDAALEAFARLKPFLNDVGQRVLLSVAEAELHEGRGQYRRAADLVELAARLAPNRADLQYRLARLSEKQGALRRAQSHLKQGQALDTPQGAAAQDAWLERLGAAMVSGAVE